MAAYIPLTVTSPGASVVVSISGVSLFADATGTTPATFPVTLTASRTWYAKPEGHLEAVVSCKVGGVEVATAAGVPARVGLQNGAGMRAVAPVVPAGTPVGLPVTTTAGRPAAASVGAGFAAYDTTLGKPIFSDGTVWRDAAGTAV